MTDPDTVLSRLGMGSLHRADVRGSGTCEVAVLDPGARTLFLRDGEPGEYGAPTGEITGLVPVSADDALGRFDSDGIRQAFGLIADRSLRATIRGETLTVGFAG